MEIVTTDSEDYQNIEALLAEYPDSTEVELVDEIACDEEGLEIQREDGEEDPMAYIQVVAQYNPNTKEGILDWCFMRESSLDKDDPNVELGGSLFGFRYKEETPDLDELIQLAIPHLNEMVSWAEFVFDEEE